MDNTLFLIETLSKSNRYGGVSSTSMAQRKKMEEPGTGGLQKAWIRNFQLTGLNGYNLPHPSSPREKFCKDEFNENNLAMLLRSEPKIEAIIKTLVNNDTQSCYLVINPFAWSYSTGNGWLFLSEHRRCILWDKEPYCEPHPMVQLVKVFASQIFNNDSDITGTQELLQAADWLLKMSKEWRWRITATYCRFLRNIHRYR